MGKVALVTGANQGLGFALVKGLCAALGSDDVVYLTARNEARGRAAVGEIDVVQPVLRFEHLDVTDDASVAELAKRIQARHGGIDVVISNAAARMSKEVALKDQVGAFVETNNHGTYRMLVHFMPILNRHARFLIIASSFGRLSQLPEQLHKQFDVRSASLADVEAVMNRYVASVQADSAEQEGWPAWINIPSKVAQVASAKIAARMTMAERPHDGILINAVCPGLIDTAASRPWFDDMSKAQSPDEAAVDLLWLAFLPGGVREPQGELVRFRQALDWP